MYKIVQTETKQGKREKYRKRNKGKERSEKKRGKEKKCRRYYKIGN
jgi:hypothetical protein